ncbi:MAG TPA: DinB family protein [Thermoanaerobaculia bacterium]
MSNRDLLLRMLDEAFQRKAWHGTNLRRSLRGVTAEEARWKPGPQRHNIWELTLHCGYWKYAVRRRLTGEKRGTFPRRGQ